MEKRTENMEKRNCARCNQVVENGLPLCDKCREGLKDFGVLAEWLNGFKGDIKDLLWVIGSEISSRECSIIGSDGCRVEMDYAEGVVRIKPIEPGNGVLEKKPWLWDRYLSVSRIIHEIGLLRRALGIVRGTYGTGE